MADVRYNQHTALSGNMADDDRIPMDKKTGASSYATRHFTPVQMRDYVVSTLGTSALADVPASGDAASDEVVLGNDSRLNDARTPTTHTHPQSEVTNLVTDLAAINLAIAGKQAAGDYITALTGDGAASGPGSSAFTLATVNSNVGSFGSAGKALTATVNAKGLVTAISETNIAIAANQVTTGQLALGRGGTGADLSATGGSGQYVKQASAGGAFTVGAIAAGDLPTAIDAAKIADGSVSNTEFQHLNGVTSGIQGQLDLKASIAYADSLVVGLLNDRGNHDASGNVFPSSGGSGTAGAVRKGDLWTISVAGTLGGTAVTAGDMVRALVDAPGQTAGNWAVSETNIGYTALNAALNDGKIYIGNGSNVGTARTLSGDVTVSNTGVTAIGANKVTDAMIRQSAGLSVVGRSANSTGNVADITASNDGEVLRRSGTAIGFGTIATAGIGDNQITNAKLATVATATFKGRTTAGTGNVEDLTATQATALLNAFVGDSGSGGTKGLVPAPTTGDASAGKFLKADGTFAVPSASVDQSANYTWTGTHIWNGVAATFKRDGIGTTNATSIELVNNTAAAAGAQQISGDLVWTAQGWKTTATAGSQTVNFRAYLLPVQGTTAPTANWILQSQINGGGFTTRLVVTSAGQIQSGGDGSASAPAYANGNSTNTGMYFPGSNQITFATGGADRLLITGASLVLSTANPVIRDNTDTSASSMTLTTRGKGSQALNGSPVYVMGGTAGTSGNRNGGDVFLIGGAKGNSGTDGNVYLGYDGSTARGFVFLGATQQLLWGTGSPESAITAPVGSVFVRSDGGASTTLYVKESGSGNTGWVAK